MFVHGSKLYSSIDIFALSVWLADESFLIIMLSLFPYPKGRMDARGVVMIRYLIMVTYLVYVGWSGVGADSPTTKVGWSANN